MDSFGSRIISNDAAVLFADLQEGIVELTQTVSRLIEKTACLSREACETL